MYNLYFYYGGKYHTNAWVGTSVDMSPYLLDTNYEYREALSFDGNTSYSSVSLNLNLPKAQLQEFIAFEGVIGAELKKEGTTIFIGYIRPNANLTIEEKAKPLNIEILDAGLMLEEAVKQDIVFRDIKICDISDPNNSLIHKVLGLHSEITFPLNTSIYNPTVITAFFIKEGETIDYILERICEEYGYAYSFGALINGIYQYGLFITDIYPTIISPAGTLAGVNIVQPLEMVKNDQEYDGVVVSWRELETDVGKLVYREIKDALGEIGVSPYLYYPPNANNKEIYQKFKLVGLDDVDLVYTSNHVIFANMDSSFSLEKSDFEPLQARVYYRNNSPLLQKIKQFDIRADVIYKTAPNEVEIDGTKPDEYKADLIHDETSAEKLAHIIYNRQKKRQFRFTFRAKSYFRPSSFVELQDPVLDINTKLLITSVRRTDSRLNIYTYEAISVANIDFITPVIFKRAFVYSAPEGTIDLPKDINLVVGKEPESILYTARGALITREITLTAQLVNMPQDEPITWTRLDGKGFEDTGDPLKKKIDCSTVEDNPLEVVISAGGLTTSVVIHSSYTGSVARVNLGGVSEVPEMTLYGEPLMAGDYFLWTGESGEQFKKGRIYEKTDTGWTESDNGDLAMTLFDSFADLVKENPNAVDEGVMSNLVIGKLAALEAFIQKLFAEQIKINNGGVIHSDFYLPSGNKNPNTNADRGFYLDSDGTFKAYEAQLVGTLRSGDNAPNNARVAIRDNVGIISGPTFTGTGINDLSIAKEGITEGDFIVEIEKVNETSAELGDITDIPLTVSKMKLSETLHFWRGTRTFVSTNGVGVLMTNSTYVYTSPDYADSNSWTGPHAPFGTNILGLYGGFSDHSGNIFLLSKGKIFRTSNGTSWSTYSTNFPDVNMRDGIRRESDGRSVVVGNDGYIMYSSGYTSWTQVRVGTANWQSVILDTNGDFLASNRNADIYRSTNGSSWSKVSTVSNLPASNYHSNAIAINPNTGVIALIHSRGHIFTSSNGGSSWTLRFSSTNGREMDDHVTMAYSGGRFIGVTYYRGLSDNPDERRVLWSDNGTNWNEQIYPSPSTVTTTHKDGEFLFTSGSAGLTGNYMLHLSRMRIYQSLHKEDRIKWSADNGSTWVTDVPILRDKKITLSGYGIEIRFDERTGHDLGDKWAFKQGNMYGLTITDRNGTEFVRATGGVLSATEIQGHLKGNVNTEETRNSYTVWGAVFN